MHALRHAALILPSLVLLGACGTESVRQRDLAPAAASTTPSVAATAVGAGTPADCRLPVGNRGIAGNGGFLNLPEGTFTADPQSLLTYDWAFSKWLPVPRAWVSPDGRRYAYAEYAPAGGQGTNAVHIVDVASGADRALRPPVPSTPISFENEGLYIGRVILNSDSPPEGLGVLDPVSGNVRQIVSDGHWTLIAPPVAWGVDIDSSIAPPRGGGLGAGNRLRQLNLSGGTAVTALTLPGSSIELIGLDGRGAPVVGITDGSTYRVAAFSAFAGLDDWFSGPVADENPAGPMAGAGARAWLSSGTSTIWERSPGSPLKMIATVPLQHPAVGGVCR